MIKDGNKLGKWLAAVILLLGAGVPRVGRAEEVPGRILLELTDEGARALAQGRLLVPVPAGGDVLEPRLEPLFRSRKGPLARYAILTFHPSLLEGSAGLPRENALWIQALSGAAGVRRAAPDEVLPVSALPDDPLFFGTETIPAGQFHLYRPGGLDVRATRAWPFVPAGPGPVVAIIDTGVNWQHPDLGGDDPLTQGVFWTNEEERLGAPGVDDDGDGFTDDVIGWDFVEVDSVCGGPGCQLGVNTPVPEEDAHTADGDPMDVAGHGTHVAGLVTALTRNGIGLAGAAPGARLMPLRVGWRTTGGQAVVYMSWCAKAIEFAALHGARVANCSWDSNNVLGLGEALDVAIGTYGMVIVGSAGNGSQFNPFGEYVARRPDCVAVASLDSTGRKSSFSNYGSWVDLASFGKGIVSTTVGNYYPGPDYGVSLNGGTSFAAPQVAAEAALVLAVNPLATAARVRDVLVGTGQDLHAVEPTYADSLGGGLADYAGAVTTEGGGWEGIHHGRGLSAFPWDRAVAYLAGSALEARDAATGFSVPGFGPALGDSTRADVLPVGAVLGSDTLLVWREGTLLRAVDQTGGLALGGPLAVPGDAPVAISRPGSAVEELLVPDGDSVRVVSLEPGLPASSFPLPARALTAGQLDADAEVEVAGVDGAGFLWVHDHGETPFSDWSVQVGEPTSLPVMAGLDALGGSVIAVPAADAVDPVHRQRLHFVAALDDTAEIVLDVPRIEFLSVAGFPQTHRAAVVAGDLRGGVHVVFGPGEWISADAGGALAGEVLCADVDGDDATDLVALRRDGVLTAWNDALQVLPGFPRVFPFGANEAPLIEDAGGRRYIVVADTAGGVWSLPVGPAGHPAPWPMARGNRGRTGYLSWERATPVATALLAWTAAPRGGTLCWSLADPDGLTSLGVRRAEESAFLWQGAADPAGCAVISLARPGDRLLFLGRDRAGAWSPLGEIRASRPAGLLLGLPEPNPFRTEVALAVSGPGPARVQVLDVRGALVASWAAPSGGVLRWAGTDGAGRPVPPGLYFLRVQAGGETAVRRVLKIGG